jgi:hypothetical protein
MNPGVVIGIEGGMWWSRETDRNEIIVVFFERRACVRACVCVCVCVCARARARGTRTGPLLRIKMNMKY